MENYTIDALAWNLATEGHLQELLEKGLTLNDALQSIHDLAYAGCNNGECPRPAEPNTIIEGIINNAFSEMYYQIKEIIPRQSKVQRDRILWMLGRKKDDITKGIGLPLSRVNTNRPDLEPIMPNNSIDPRD